MATPQTRFEFPIPQWQACKAEVTAILRGQLYIHHTILYGVLVKAIRNITFTGPNDHRFHRMLGDISEDTNEQSRTMLSALVINQRGRPGSGFFDLARELGRRGDDDAIWARECKRLGL